MITIEIDNNRFILKKNIFSHTFLTSSKTSQFDILQNLLDFFSPFSFKRNFLKWKIIFLLSFLNCQIFYMGLTFNHWTPPHPCYKSRIENAQTKSSFELLEKDQRAKINKKLKLSPKKRNFDDQWRNVFSFVKMS